MRRLPVLAGLAAVLTVAGCAVAPAPGAVDRSGTPTIALLLPESKTARYEGVDRPAFERVVADRCPDCRVLYANAGQDAALQQQQAESALTRGASVLVLDAVDAASARSIVAAAASRGVDVVAYDRFVPGADYFVSFDSVRIGRLQAQALVGAVQLGPGDGVLLVNGAATDPNAAALKEGVLPLLEEAGVPVLAQYDTPDWSPDKAQDWVSGQLTQYAGHVVGIAAANDGTAGGAISAMRAAGIYPLPPVTGQDAELAAIQRIVAGEQYMTVYKALSQQARTAAELAVRLLRGETPVATARVEGVPAMLLEPLAVTRDRVQAVVVDGGVYTVDQICVEPYVAACREAGLLEPEDGR